MPTNNAPQSVSARYAHNLLCRGSNRVYELEDIRQTIARTVNGMPCGFYYVARVKRKVDFEGGLGEGMTPTIATISALSSLGVTFR